MKNPYALYVDNCVYNSKKLFINTDFLLTTLWITALLCAYLLGFHSEVGNSHPAFS